MHMTQQGVKNVKKKFHNRLAALRTASKVEIEAADNICPIIGFSALENEVKFVEKYTPATNFPK